MPFNIFGANSVSGYTVKNSLRFNHSSSDYLSRTPASAGNRKTFTYSFWTKRSGGDSLYPVLFDSGSNSTTRDSFFFNKQNGDFLHFYCLSGGSVFVELATSQLFRDYSAWYHIVLAVDTTQATASNRIKIYLNGSQITSFQTSTYPSQNTDMNTNNTVSSKIGGSNNTSYYYDGYLADYYFIDGQALTPSSFGETDTATGIWKPKAYTGTYGTNGFYLKFANSASLGTDSSGNGNTFTVNNLTSIDQTTDTPTNNFCTMNPLDFGYNATANASFSEGNLKITGNTTAWRGAHGTIGVSKGKWYFEGKAIGVPDGDTGVYIGWCDPALETTYNPGNNNASYNFYAWTNGTIKSNTSSTGSYYTFTENDICGFALDLDNGKGYISKNGTFYNNNNTSSTPNTSNPDFTITTPPTNSGVLVPCIIGYNDGGFFLNFGNPPYSANSYTDGAGYGNFSYSVPSGYYSLNTRNLANFG
jgi:hypothetical protein